MTWRRNEEVKEKIRSHSESERRRRTKEKGIRCQNQETRRSDQRENISKRVGKMIKARTWSDPSAR